jgi:SdrD B-like protein
MSQGINQNELQEKTQKLLQGPLKHVRAAALAAALLPLASVVATPATAQTVCGSAGNVCGFVWNDANNNGVQDAGESGIEGVKVYASDSPILDTATAILVETGPDGYFYYGGIDGAPVTLFVQIPAGSQPSPTDSVTTTDSLDSDGTLDGASGASAETITANGYATDFGFFKPAVQAPGTGTPGYWKNHPEAWPVGSITIGGVTYLKADAIAWLGKVGKDKTTTMFSSLVSAKLNVLLHNEDSCVSATITSADSWMAFYGPVGSKVAASSAAWAEGEPLHILMDNYNNGLLCAKHRN